MESGKRKKRGGDDDRGTRRIKTRKRYGKGKGQNRPCGFKLLCLKLRVKSADMPDRSEISRGKRKEGKMGSDHFKNVSTERRMTTRNTASLPGTNSKLSQWVVGVLERHEMSNGGTSETKESRAEREERKNGRESESWRRDCGNLDYL